MPTAGRKDRRRSQGQAALRLVLPCPTCARLVSAGRRGPCWAALVV
jgi:hypothetical protein